MAASRVIAATRFCKKLFKSSATRTGFISTRLASSKPVVAVPEHDYSKFTDPGWPDDGMALGEYPNLPLVSAQRRQMTGWWDKQDRRNYGEPICEEEDSLNIWVWTQVECNDKYTPYQVLGHFAVAFGLLGCIAFASYVYDAPSRNPAVPKQYPYNNLYQEMGGNTSMEPSEKALSQKIPSAT